MTDCTFSAATSHGGRPTTRDDLIVALYYVLLIALAVFR